MNNVIIIDSSGSMGENGKRAVIANVRFAVVNTLKYEYPDFEYNTYLWSSSVEELKKPVFSGKGDAGALKSFFEEKGVDNALFITDGNFSSEVKAFLKTVSDKCSVLTVGCDCNRAAVNRIFKPERIYNTADAVTCAENFVHKG